MNTRASSVISSPVTPSPVILGEFKLYDTAGDKELADTDGSRIVKCLQQVNQKTKVKDLESKYVRIPTAHITEQIVVAEIDLLAPYVMTFLQETEDTMIKAQYKAGGVERIYVDGLSIQKILDYLDSKGLGQRLTKEKISAWFLESVQPNLEMLFAEKMGIDSDSDESLLLKLESVVVAYSSKFQMLAGGKTLLAIADCDALISVLIKCDAQDSDLGRKFIPKLEKMKESNSMELEAL